jgi:hypothetical protein
MDADISDTNGEPVIADYPEWLPSVLDFLLAARFGGPVVQPPEQDIINLCTEAKKIFLAQPMVLELTGGVNVHYSLNVANKRACETDPNRSLVILMDNTLTCCESSNAAVILDRLQITSFSATISATEQSLWKFYALFWLTRFDILKTFFFCAVATKPRR